MLSGSESLLPAVRREDKKQRALVVSFSNLGGEPEEVLRLLDTLGISGEGPIDVHLRVVSPATYLGKGKLDEVFDRLGRSDADFVVFDAALSPSQMRNLEKRLKAKVVDRPGVILEIFSRHAKTNEAKAQVELARLKYLLPRLRHYWTHFERQRGGGAWNKGMGEKQIEIDRRLVLSRIARLEKKLTGIQKGRKTQREGRKDFFQVALVGYTNSGKSTILNALTRSDVLAKDELFATLDSSVRSLDPSARPPIVLIDTVGFIRDIPTALIASFRSTLEELQHADLLVHVVDGSSKRAREEMQTTIDVIEDLELSGKPVITVLNKMDLLEGSALNWARVVSPGALLLSAQQREDMLRLREAVFSHFEKLMEVFEVVIPYELSKIHSQIQAYGVVEQRRELDKGIFYRLRMSQVWKGKLQLKKFQTSH